jgi:hypothetical protein
MFWLTRQLVLCYVVIALIYDLDGYLRPVVGGLGLCCSVKRSKRHDALVGKGNISRESCRRLGSADGLSPAAHVPVRVFRVLRK